MLRFEFNQGTVVLLFVVFSLAAILYAIFKRGITIINNKFLFLSDSEEVKRVAGQGTNIFLIIVIFICIGFLLSTALILILLGGGATWRSLIISLIMA